MDDIIAGQNIEIATPVNMVAGRVTSRPLRDLAGHVGGRLTGIREHRADLLTQCRSATRIHRGDTGVRQCRQEGVVDRLGLAGRPRRRQR